MKLVLTTIFLFFQCCINAQTTSGCGLSYGTDNDKDSITYHMRYGTIDETITAINNAKNSRGSLLGCPDNGIVYSAPNTSEPTLNDIVTIWNTAHAPLIENYTIGCPRIGRYENNAALGAYYARLAGYFTDTAKLREIGDMMYDQQYAEWNIMNPTLRNEGVYGYVYESDTMAPCYIGGVVGKSVNDLCTTLPKYCKTYTGGQFAGKQFAISAQDDTASWFDGGIAYDHGWIGTQLIEASIQQSNVALKQKYRNSVELAGQFAIQEHCVRNHNYTAKLIWLLAQVYAWTGDEQYQNELNYKLDKNLIPGVLWDGDNDGYVDSTSPKIAFSSLTTNAQTPGRMWDGHNAEAWYQAMNTWAMTEAYVAFRDRGDDTRADELKPYVIAMLDNLADEIISQGVISTHHLGVRDITYALLIGIWKVSQYEKETHSKWEQAAWAMWNKGYFNAYNTYSVCVGLYLLIQSNTAYQPLALREEFIITGSKKPIESSAIRLYPNPVVNQIHVNQSEVIHIFDQYQLYSTTGTLLLKGKLSSSLDIINIEHLPQGYYFLQCENNTQRVIRKVVKIE